MMLALPVTLTDQPFIIFYYGLQITVPRSWILPKRGEERTSLWREQEGWKRLEHVLLNFREVVLASGYVFMMPEVKS